MFEDMCPRVVQTTLHFLLDHGLILEALAHLTGLRLKNKCRTNIFNYYFFCYIICEENKPYFQSYLKLSIQYQMLYLQLINP